MIIFVVLLVLFIFVEGFMVNIYKKYMEKQQCGRCKKLVKHKIWKSIVREVNKLQGFERQR